MPDTDEFRKKLMNMNSRDKIRLVADLFDFVEPETPEEVDDALRDAGYDPEEIGCRMACVARDALASIEIKK